MFKLYMTENRSDNIWMHCGWSENIALESTNYPVIKWISSCLVHQNSGIVIEVKTLSELNQALHLKAVFGFKVCMYVCVGGGLGRLWCWKTDLTHPVFKVFLEGQVDLPGKRGWGLIPPSFLMKFACNYIVNQKVAGVSVIISPNYSQFFGKYSCFRNFGP